MKNAKLLDCTLRDGGYLIDEMFGDEVIRGMIMRLNDAGIDIIECGFLKDTPHKQDCSSFSDVDELIPFIPVDRSRNTSYVLLADYSRYSANTLKPHNGKSIDGIRECFQKHERKDAMRVAGMMKNAGYKVYMQPVDILGYTTAELLELIEWINELEPYTLSIVDTFGSMLLDDLRRLYSLIDYNLKSCISIGFHSHNNLQMSAALSQECIALSRGVRELIIDSTICGMGRGAGNTNTELIADFLNRKYNYKYDLDVLLDIIDVYMPGIMNRCKWGYSVPTFIAGIYNVHVHNITYLIDKHNINSKNMRQIIEGIDPIVRKSYDYENLENLYIKHIGRFVNDKEVIDALQKEIVDQEILVIAPGMSSIQKSEIIHNYIAEHKPIVISVNSIFAEYKPRYAFFSSFRRFEYSQEYHKKDFLAIRKIITSNIDTDIDNNTYQINYNDYIKKGWEHFDNSTIMLVRLLLKLNTRRITFAGFDGYRIKPEENYADSGLQINMDSDKIDILNREISEMLSEIFACFDEVQFSFITDSLYSKMLKKRANDNVKWR